MNLITVTFIVGLSAVIELIHITAKYATLLLYVCRSLHTKVYFFYIDAICSYLEHISLKKRSFIYYSSWIAVNKVWVHMALVWSYNFGNLYLFWPNMCYKFSVSTHCPRFCLYVTALLCLNVAIHIMHFKSCATRTN